jgi:hypothetical protein
MPATQIPQDLSDPYLSDPASLSFARRGAKPFRERALREPDGGQGFEERQRALQQIVCGGCTQQDCGHERVIQELLLLLQDQELSLRAVNPSEPVNQYGFPQPGKQSPSPAEATGRHYFVNETNWQEILDYGEFDDIVCGSGFCALAYIDKALDLDPHRKILVLERGGFWLPAHFQNLPLPFNLLLGGESETFPWSLTSTTYNSEIQFMRGSCPFFGGRSTFWSAWCPRPRLDLLRDFPQSLIETAKQDDFWKDCQALLHVVKATALHNDEYQILQEYIDNQLKIAVDPSTKTIDTADYAETSDLAVGRTTALSNLVFEKFATPGPLLDIFERQRRRARKGTGSPLKIATDVAVKRFNVDPEDVDLKRVNILYTSRGDLCFPRKKPNIILATGAIPACTIVQNSIAEQRTRAGSRLSGHFLTHIVARFLIPEGLKATLENKLHHLELAASYLAGHDPATKLQYHADITSIHSPYPETDAVDAARLCPDFFSAPSEAQLKGSEKHIIIACVMLGEIDEDNPECWVRPDPNNPDVTTNIRLQITLSDKDKSLRKVMHTATLQAIDAMAGKEKPGLQYWHDNGDGTGRWEAMQPDISKFMMSGIVHESSTLYMSDDLTKDEHASINSHYQVKGSGNVYATGAAIFPSSGSWNPTLTMCGFAQDLAAKLVPKRQA